tara:strand:- start:65 stop:523 length:459 start_codon:yes stop_codon:yes gene_type:complete
MWLQLKWQCTAIAINGHSSRSISKTKCVISHQKRQSAAIGAPRRGHCNRFAAKGDGAVDNPQAASPGPPNHGALGKEGSIETSASSTIPKSKILCGVLLLECSEAEPNQLFLFRLKCLLCFYSSPAPLKYLLGTSFTNSRTKPKLMATFGEL